MRLSIDVHLDYRLPEATDLLVQIEAARLDDQRVEDGTLTAAPDRPLSRVAGEDGVGERFWVKAGGSLVIDYRATVAIDRPAIDCTTLSATPLADLPAATIGYLMGSRYCPSEMFQTFVDREFAGLSGGARAIAMRDWIAANLRYRAAMSSGDTTALEIFARREGICRDYAHLMIAFARASGIPARIASVYAPGVDPPDFHAVAQVWLDGGWHLIDATGMATPADIAIIGVGRDAADVAFLTAYGDAEMVKQTVRVTRRAEPRSP